MSRTRIGAGPGWLGVTGLLLFAAAAATADQGDASDGAPAPAAVSEMRCAFADAKTALTGYLSERRSQVSQN